MQTTEITEYEFEGQGSLVLRAKDELLGISADPEVLLDKYEVQELIVKLQSIVDYMPITDDEE